MQDLTNREFYALYRYALGEKVYGMTQPRHCLFPGPEKTSKLFTLHCEATTATYTPTETGRALIEVFKAINTIDGLQKLLIRARELAYRDYEYDPHG